MCVWILTRIDSNDANRKKCEAVGEKEKRRRTNASCAK
jgi:hypothetical protein